MSPSSSTQIDTDYVVLLLRSTSTDTRVPSAAWVTQWSCQWLMGRCQLNDVQLADGTTQRSGVLVEKCKYLEESGCAGICVHTCKMPTQVSQTSCAYFALCYVVVPGVACLRPDAAKYQAVSKHFLASGKVGRGSGPLQPGFCVLVRGVSKFPQQDRVTLVYPFQ
jgi:hypothetical protein